MMKYQELDNQIYHGRYPISKMDELTQNECLVSGMLHYILRISSIVGTVPVTFKKRKNGCSIRVSSGLYYYDVVFGTVVTALSMATVIINQCAYPEWSVPRQSVQIVSLIEVVLQGLIVCAATYTGRSRMKCLIEYLIQFQKISSKLPQIQRRPRDRIRTILVIGLFLLSVINICTGFFLSLNQAAYIKQSVFKMGLYAFWNFSNIVVAVIFNQIAEILMAVFTSIQTVNLCLKVMLQELKDAPDPFKLQVNTNQNNISREAIDVAIDTKAIPEDSNSPEALKDLVRRYSNIYCYICDVVRKTNDCHGVVMVVLMMSLVFHLIMTPYYIITILVKNTSSMSIGPVILINWYTMHCGCLLMIVDPCHRTHEEMGVTKNLVLQMMYYTATEQEAVFSELKMFYRHLLLNQVTFSPMQMFDINRELILRIVGSITTYLVIVIQL